MKCAEEPAFASSNQVQKHTLVEHRANDFEVCFTKNECFLSELPLRKMDSDRNQGLKLQYNIGKKASAGQALSEALLGR